MTSETTEAREARRAAERRENKINAIRATERRNRVQEAHRALEKAVAAYPQDSDETATLYEALALIDGIR